jgi:hypothetical protein
LSLVAGAARSGVDAVRRSNERTALAAGTPRCQRPLLSAAESDRKGSMGSRPPSPALCLACSFPVDGERSLLGVVNRFQEMLAHVGCTVGELVMRSEPGGRTTLRLDLACGGPRGDGDDITAKQTTLPESVGAAAAGRRSSCRMCASACSMSNCDAACDHDAAETSPAHVEHPLVLPPDRMPSLVHQQQNARHLHVRASESAPQTRASRPHVSVNGPNGVPARATGGPLSDPVITERISVLPSNAQTGHHHHRHHHHHHMHNGKSQPLVESADNAVPDAGPSHMAATLRSSPSRATGSNSYPEDDAVNRSGRFPGGVLARAPTSRNIHNPRKRRRGRGSSIRGPASGFEVAHAPRKGVSDNAQTTNPTPQSEGGAFSQDPLEAGGILKSTPASCVIADAPRDGQVGTKRARKDHELESNRTDLEAGDEQLTFEKQSCGACEEVFQNDLDAQRHHLTAHPAPSVKNVDGRVECPVPECHQDFAREHVMRRHIQSVHLHIREFPCSSCDRVFADQSTLNQHVTAVHLKRKPWTCPVCGVSFTQSSSLGKHRRRFHVGAAPNGTVGADEPGGLATNDSRENDYEDLDMNDPRGEFTAHARD